MYYTIYEFMVSELKLSGTDLNVFAIIFSFRVYKGSLETLKKFAGVKSITTIQYSLQRLVSNGFIQKEKSDNKFSTCTYTVAPRYLKYLKNKENSSLNREWQNEENEIRIGVKL